VTTPEQAYATAVLLARQPFEQAISNNKASIAASDAAAAAIKGTAQKLRAQYEADLEKTRKNHADDVGLLKQEREADVAEMEAEIARKEFELSLKNVDIAKLNLDVTENKMSSYNYKFDRDALCVAIEEKFGETVRNELIADMNEIAAEFREDDADEGFPRLENHRLWGS